jgi:hypothetical protein
MNLESLVVAVGNGRRNEVDMDLLEKMEQLLQDCREDYNKAKGGNKAAGTRVRKVMQDVKGVAQDIRKEMLGSREG